MYQFQRQHRKLVALYRHLPQTERIEYVPYVRDYNAALFALQTEGFDVKGFWIPLDQIQHVPDASFPRSVDRDFFLARLEGLIGVLELGDGRVVVIQGFRRES